MKMNCLFISACALLIVCTQKLYAEKRGQYFNKSIGDNKENLIAPIARWNFDEGCGEIAKNASGDNCCGNIYGAKWVKGKNRQALSFDGDDNYVLIKTNKNSKGFDEPEDLTVEAWIKQESYWNRHAGDCPATGKQNAGQLIIALLDNEQNPLYSFGIVKGQLGLDISYKTDDGNWQTQSFATRYHKDPLIPLNKWTHVAAVCDNKSITLYINGQKELTQKLNIRLPRKTASICIGGYSSNAKKENGKYFQGVIDEVTIYNKPLSFSPETCGFIANAVYGACIETSAPPLSPGPSLKTEVKRYNGIPTLFINGKPEPALICREQTRPQDKTDYLQKISLSGINIFIYAIHLPSFNEAQNNYKSLEEFYEKFIFERYNNQSLKKIIDDVPDALFLIQVLTDVKVRNAPKWAKKNSDEITVWPITPNTDKCPKIKGKNKVMGDRVSICSELWREKTVKHIRALIKHLRKSPFADKIVGYCFFGPPSEWGDYWDYSKPAQKAFKRWIKNKYKDDLNSFRKAWNNNQITFENISIPELEELHQGDVGIFYNPRETQRLIDYLDYYHDMSREAISEFAKAAKQACQRENVVGTWGYAQFYPGWARDVNEGLQATRKTEHFDKLGKDPNIDFFLICHAYRERHAGGIYCPQFMPDNIILNGKLAINEDDTRTCMTTQGHSYFKNAEVTGDNFGHAKSIEDTIAVLKRNFAGVYSKPGGGIAWYSIGGAPGMAFNHPRILETFKTFSQITNELLGKDKENSQIAVIFSQKSLYYQKFNWLRDDLISRLATEGLPRIGAPFDSYFANDLLNKDFPFKKYKFYIFANTFYLSDKERNTIKEKIQANGNTVLWIYASGLIREENLSPKATSDLIGMDIAMSDTELQKGLEINLVNYLHPISKGLASDLRYGTRNSISPVLWCKDKNVLVLGEEVSSSHKVWTFCQPGLCVKKFKNWTSIWSGAPNPPSSLLRNIAQYAGVHIYSEYGDQIFASEKLLSIHTRYTGKRTIRLPKRSNIYDPFKKIYIAKDVDKIELNIPKNTTELWLLR